jgi:hypothetical protein
MVFAFMAGVIGCFFFLIFYRWVTKFEHSCCIYLNIGISLSGVIMFPINIILYKYYISLFMYYLVIAGLTILGVISYLKVNWQKELIIAPSNSDVPLTQESVLGRISNHSKVQILGCAYQAYISVGYLFTLSSISRAYENTIKDGEGGLSYLHTLNAVHL